LRRSVWSRDDETGAEGWKPVMQLFVTPNRVLLDLELLEADGDGQELLVTSEHPLWTESGWTTVGDLKVGALVWGHDGWAEVVSVESTGRTETVYNFEVRDFHSYYVGESGVWAHNAPCVGMTTSQMTKTVMKHGDDFGVGTHWNKRMGRVIKEAVDNHVRTALEVTGRYRGVPATHYLNMQSGLNVVVDMKGNFVAGFRLRGQQLQNVLRSGALN